MKVKLLRTRKLFARLQYVHDGYDTAECEILYPNADPFRRGFSKIRLLEAVQGYRVDHEMVVGDDQLEA